jgi:polyisoprenyl-phosphate glycosyltransferase
MGSATVLLSVVSPVYRSEACVDELYQRVTAVLRALTDSYEIILVEDGSPDQSWARIAAIAARDPHVVGLQLSRNFGQHRAIAAGLTASRGQYVVVMDCDLQDPPECIPALFTQLQTGYDIVYTQRRSRVDSTFKQVTSYLFSRLLNALAPLAAPPGRGALSIISRQVVEAYLQVVDVHQHYLSVLHWLGFRSMSINIPQAPRFAGVGSYSLNKLLSLAFNALVSHSTRLLHFSTAMGLLFAVFAALQICYLVYRKLAHEIGIDGWASLMVTLWFVGGAILFSLGVLGLYVGRMFEHTRRRPLFLVREQLNGGDDSDRRRQSSCSEAAAVLPAGSPLPATPGHGVTNPLAETLGDAPATPVTETDQKLVQS